MLDLKKKLVLNSIIILIIIFFISFTSASECYQESTNASNARDGSCTLNYTGSYGEVGDDIGFGSLWYDGNWGTGGTYPYNGWGQQMRAYSIYKIPTGATNVTWIGKYAEGSDINFTYTITNAHACWGYVSGEVAFGLSYFDIYGSEFFCGDMSGVFAGTSLSSGFFGYPSAFYEEAVIWGGTFATADTTPPLVSILYPLNTTYKDVTSLNYTASDDVGLSSCWYFAGYSKLNTTGLNKTASTQYAIDVNASLYPPENAFDNDTDTFWWSNSTANDIDNQVPHDGPGNWLMIDFGLGNEKQVTKTRINHQDSAGIEGLIQASNDSSGWVNLTSFNHPDMNVWFNNTFVNSISYRYYRIYITNQSVPYNGWVKINEFELYEKGDKTIITTNLTNLTSNQGSNTWTIYCNDTMNNTNSSSVTFFKDSIIPTISIIYPTNTSYNMDITTLNFHASDTNIDTCWYSVNGGANTTHSCSTNVTGLTTNQGSNLFEIWVNDSAGNTNTSSVRFVKDTINPNATLISPITNIITKNPTINFTVNLSDGTGLANATLYIYDSIGNLYNQTTATFTGAVNHVLGITVSLADGAYHWFYEVFDTSGNKALSMSSGKWWVGVTPTAYWKLENNLDSSGNGYPFTNINGPSYQTASGILNKGTGLYYNEYLIKNDIDLSGLNFQTNPFTIALWYKDQNGAAANRNVLTSTDWNISYKTSGASIVFSNTNGAILSQSIDPSNWNRIVIIRDSSNQLKIYINGNLTSSTTDNTNYSTMSEISLGFPYPNIFWKMYIDDIQIFNGYAWTSSNVITDYNNGVGLEADTQILVNNTLTIDSTPPNSTLISPINNTHTSSKTINFIANISDNVGIANYTFYVYNSTGLVNETTVLTPTNPLIEVVGVVTNLVNGVYHWFYSLFDTAGNSFVTSNNSLIVYTLSIIRDHQIPADITSLNVVRIPANITMNITHSNAINLSTVTFYYKVNSTRGSTSFINGTDRSNLFNSESFYISNSSDKFLFYGDDNDVYPATYNLGEENMEDAIHTARLLASSASYFSIQLLNVSNKTQYNFFEVMLINATAASNPSTIYYCNSTYVTGNPSTNVNCVNIGSVTRGGYNHCHDEHTSVYSCQQVIPYTINTTTGKIGTVKVTPTSRFLVRGSSGGDWNVYSVPTVARVGAMRSSTNNGNTWANDSYTFDSHTHQYDGIDELFYYVCANDTSGNSACSPTYTDLISLGGLPPQPGTITHPVAGSYQLGLMNINYTAFESPNAYPIVKYNISLYNSINHLFNESIIANNELNLSYIWNTTTTSYGNYVIHVTGCDNSSLCSTAISDDFSLSPALSIISVSSPTITLNSGTTKTEFIQFNTSAVSSNSSSAQIVLTKGSETRTSLLCTNISYLFTCEVIFEFYDSAGVWDINASIRDSFNTLYVNDTYTTTINALDSVEQDVNYLNWSSVYAGNSTILSDNPLILKNTGNQNYNNISILGLNLSGIAYSGNVPVYNFRAYNSSSLDISSIPSCYQETANSATAGDGVCGLSYTGSYLTSGDWSAFGSGSAGETYDGDWGTFGLGGFAGDDYLYVNYTKPSGAASAILQTKTAIGYKNNTVPNACFNQPKLDFEIKAIDNGAGVANYSCYNGVSYESFGSDSSPQFFEEAIIWEVASTSGTSLVENELIYIPSLINLNNHGASVNQSIYFYLTTGTNIKADTYKSLSNWRVQVQ